MRIKTRIILLSIVAGFLIWFVDGLIDYFVFYEGTFWGLLITDVPRHEVYIRSGALVLFVVFGVYVAGIVQREQKAKRNLALGERKWYSTLASIGDAVITTDPEGRVSFMNQVAEGLTGWQLTRAANRPIEEIFNIINEHSREKVESPVDRVLKEGIIIGLANRTVLIARDGREIPIDDSGAPIRSSTGQIVGTVLVFHDVTEHREADRKLEESRARYQMLFNEMIDGFALHEIICDDHGKPCDYRFLELNPAFEKLTGMVADQVIGKTIKEIMPNIESFWIDTYGDVALNGTTKRFTNFAKPLRKWFEVAAFSPEPGKFATIFVDITGRKKTESAVAAVAESGLILNGQDFYEQIVIQLGQAVEADYVLIGRVEDNQPDRVRTLAVCQGDKLMDNIVYELAGTPCENVVGQRICSYPSGVAEQFPKDVILVEMGVDGYAGIPLFGSDGQPLGILVALYKSPIRDPELAESLIGLFASRISAEIERQEAAAALYKEKETLAVTLKSIGDGVIATDTKGQVVLMNLMAQQMTGWTEEESLGRPLSEVFDIINEESRQPVENPVKKVLRSGHIVGLANHTLLIKKDKTEISIADSGAPIIDSDNETVGVVLAFRDVTETLRLQDLAERARRLEAAGTVAGQVAHDFNNLLAPVMSYPELIREELPDGHPAHPYVDQIEQAAEQMAEINQQLLTLGRRGHYEVEPLDLNEVLVQVLNQPDLFPDEIEVERDLSANIMNVMGGMSQIFRAISNLVSNAVDACDGPGRIVVKTENYYADTTKGANGQVPQGEYVKLTVSDNGRGIAENVRSRVFEPFFTTKPPDRKRGSGLGLSVVQAVLDDHHAYIDLESELGVGTSFYVYLPVTRVASGKTSDLELVGGSESVLVIDDDRLQRDVMVRLCERLGYRAESVDGGEGAIKLLAHKSYDILILDMVMPPGIDGTETYRRALQFNPKQKALIISGFAENDLVDEVIRLGAGAFVRKPLTLNAISAALRNELNRAKV